MKSRSHRLPTISDTPDDWVDESWTVDCVCGVNFDDGEEMVNCDECGVWVHTRCSRYVKSEKLFACDKCKSKRLRNESEETEVAQLLVELPTKTLRMDNPGVNCPPPNPLQVWTDIPLEEKVHVQGIPGGDPSLFGGYSSVFGPELWKCTGYVPKKFNFQYREFPCWDERQEDNKCKEDIGNPASKGADVLFSLSKDNALPGTASVLAGMKSQLDNGRSAFGTLASAINMKKQVVENSEVKRQHSGGKKERSLMKPIVIHSVKRKKEDSKAFKDLSGKKKAKVLDKDQELQKRGVHSSKSVSIMSTDARLSESSEGKSPKVVKTDMQSCQHGNSRADMHAIPKSESFHGVDSNVGLTNEIPFSSGQPSENICPDDSRHNRSKEAKSMEQKDGHQVPMRMEISPQSEDGVASSLRHNDTATVPIEAGHDAIDDMIDNGRRSPCRSYGTQPHVDDLENAATATKDHQSFQESNCELLASSLQHVEVKPLEVSHPVENSSSKSLPTVDVKLDSLKSSAQDIGISDLMSASGEVKDDAISGSQSRDQKVQNIDKSATIVDCQADEPDESPCDPCQSKCYLMGSESSVIAQKNSSEFRHGPGPFDDASRSHGTVVSPSGAPNHRKATVSAIGKNSSAGKPSSSSSAVGLTKPSVPGKVRYLNSENRNSISKQKETCHNNHNGKRESKDNTSSDVPRDGEARERPKKIAKELPKSLSTSALKSSNLSKLPHAVSKKNSSDSKVPVSQSSSKTSSVQKTAGTPESGDSANSLQGDGGLHSQNRSTSAASCLRAEKLSQSTSQSAPKNHPPSLHPPAPTSSAAALSDEELALLLHQELNSSPRVPRVPRMRHAGSLPHLASPTATSMLVKRTSSSGGKDSSLVSRKKNKDLVKDVASNSRELDDGAKKVDRVPSLPNSRRHEQVESGSAKVTHSSVERGVPPSSTTVSSGPSSSAEANEQIMSSKRTSPQNGSDDDTGPIGHATHRTLPGLIAEIMSTGKRMTYEELCNAVLPHWPNLRKHNGERYAYSSHSQAVLDCLRNRSEWSRLVDRGPKTNAGRKRRKLEAEPQSHESEENDYNKDRNTKEVDCKSLESHRDEFPKGKRKARKRRRLALQGRGIKDVRRRRKAEVVSDDIDSSSSSSEGSLFSDEEVQGRTSVVNEASASSDETGAMS